MIVPDANLLLYAYDRQGRFHHSAARWWESCLNGSEPVGLCVVVILAYLRVGTNPRIFSRPMSVGEATDSVTSWLNRSVVSVLDAREPDLAHMLSLLTSLGAAGNLTTDALIAAIAMRTNGVVHSADTDFARFPGLRWTNPLNP